MPLRNTCAVLLNRGGATVRPAEIAQTQGISTGQASVDLSRLVKMGVARKVGRGKYALFDRQKAVDFLNRKTQQNTTRDTMGDTMVPGGVMVRPHRIWFKAKVQNYPTIKAIKAPASMADTWRYWKPNQHSTMYEKTASLPNGLMATVRYAEGPRKRTITVQVEGVLVNGDTLEDHMRDITAAVETALRALSRTDGFDIGLIMLTCDHHFAIPLPVTGRWKLPPPGIIKINDFWWLDSSTGWPEIETHLQAQAKKLVELPDKVDALPAAIREAIRQTIQELLGAPAQKEPAQPQDNTGGMYH